MRLPYHEMSPIWHPFTQMQGMNPPVMITKGKASRVYDDAGKAYLDLISSWWVNLHGHSHPKIAAAIASQAATLEHILFAGFTHPPAQELAQKLCKLLHPSLTRVFFSDNGSTAVEVALKMATQFWVNQGETGRKRFICFEGAYHGDTFGSMAVGQSSGFFKAFESMLFPVDTLPLPHTWHDDTDREHKEEKALKALDAHLITHGAETIAMIIEPLMQGSSGMRHHRATFLQQVVEKCRTYGICIIFDEVMTGFGRLGTLFAYERMSVAPDIICLAKGLTGGFLPLAVTVCNNRIYQAFLSQESSHTFAHGHSYTANPLGCAAALASLDLFAEENTLSHIKQMEAYHLHHCAHLESQGLIHKIRILGSLCAFESPLLDPTYGTEGSQQLRQRFMKEGLILRPLGKVIYLMPPYCTTANDLAFAYDRIAHVLGEL